MVLNKRTNGFLRRHKADVILLFAQIGCYVCKKIMIKKDSEENSLAQ